MTRCIMAVDDDGEVLDVLAILLPQEGYDVARSSMVQAQPAMIEQIKPDLILLDCKAGLEARGCELAQEVKRHPATAAIPIVMCSASRKTLDGAAELLQSKSVTVLYKPYSLCELLSAVRAALV
jgi:DNA-binding response OmpR family regulator